MPDTIQFRNGNRIVNIYSADGNKLKTEYGTFTSTLIAPITEGTVFNFYYGIITKSACNYIGNLEYTVNGSWDASSLFRIHNPEGYYNGSTGYTYYRKDHLGNVREVWQANKNRTIQRTQYYPSGLPWAEGLAPSEQPYKYNGKEFIEMSGYDTFDYGARGYYPALGRFTSVDPLAEKYYSISPYAYCAGNPVRYIDPTGMSMDDYQLKDDGRIDLIKKTDDDHDVLYASDKNGNADKNTSITLNKDILSSKVTEQIKTINGPETIDYYTSFDNNQSTAFSNFVSDNSNAEWANSKFSVDGQVGYENVSFISTSGGDGSSGSVSYLFDKYLSKFNYKGFNHSHTNNTEQVSPGDINVATDISKKFPDAKFNIYIPLTGALIPYNKNSTSGLLHEATVIGKAPHKINK